MSLHDELAITVEQQREKYKKHGFLAGDAMSFLLRVLPTYFGGGDRSYSFCHPTRSGESGRNNLTTQLLPEEGDTFVTALIIEAGTRFVFFLRFSNFVGSGVTVTLVGHDDVTCVLGHDEKENAAHLATYFKHLGTLAKQRLLNDPRLAVKKVVVVNKYEGKEEPEEQT